VDRLSTGIIVRDIRGRRVGKVASLNSCCYEVINGENRNLVAASIFNVAIGEVTLICDIGELARYRCQSHGVPQPAPG
jgi:hypothetical protein